MDIVLHGWKILYKRICFYSNKLHFCSVEKAPRKPDFSYTSGLEDCYRPPLSESSTQKNTCKIKQLFGLKKLYALLAETAAHELTKDCHPHEGKTDTWITLCPAYWRTIFTFMKQL